MRNTDRHLQVHEDGGVVRVSLRDANMLDDAEIQEIRSQIGTLIQKRATPKLVLDFSHVERLSSTALGALIVLREKIQGRSGQLALAGVSAHVRRIFAISRLDTLFQFYATPEQAQAGLA